MKLSQTGKYSSSRYSIYSCPSHGPIFGGGHDIWITNYASSNTNSLTNLGHTYSPPSGHSYLSSFTKSFLTGSNYFQPDEIEVFYESTKWSSDDIQNSCLHLFTNNRSRLFCLGCLWAKVKCFMKVRSEVAMTFKTPVYTYLPTIEADFSAWVACGLRWSVLWKYEVK